MQVENAEAGEKVTIPGRGDVDVIAQITGEMPEPQEHAIAAEAEETQQKAESAQRHSHLKDRDGTPFNPDLHETDANGNPKQNQDGTLKKRRGRKQGKDYSAAGGSQLNASKSQMQPGQMPIEAGKQIAESIFAIGQLVGGEEWAPIKNQEYGIDERRQMHDAWANYCAAKEIRDVPPGVALTIAILGYVVPRFYMPKTKSRMAKLKDWGIAFYVNNRHWFSFGRKKSNARVDRGNNNERKDDNSKKDGASIPSKGN